jgi:hypothetical protein
MVAGLAVFAATTARTANGPGFLRPAEATNLPFHSPTQHYIFRGLNAEDQVALARWFEEIEVRVESMTGLEVPFQRAELIKASGLSAPPANQGEVRLTQGHVEGLLHQKLLLVNPEVVEELEVAEALVLLLLNRYTLDIQTRRGDAIIPFQVPDWLTAGLTQNLRSGWRDRNAAYVAERWLAGRGRTVASVLRLKEVERMRSDERAFCGMVVAWMTDELMDAGAWDAVFKRLARGAALDPLWVREHAFGFESDLDMEKSWDLWLAGQTLVRRDLGTVTPELLGQLRVLLRRTPDAVGLTASPGTPEDLQPGDLIERRDQAWIRPYATRTMVDLEEMASGRAPEFQQVVDLYKGYYTSLIRAGGDRGGLLARSSAGAALRSQLDTAEAARATLERTIEVRGAYLQGVEAELDVPDLPSDPSLRKSRMDFLRGVEERISP